MRKLFTYLNPMAHLGERKYSLLFPLIISLLLSIFSEIYSYEIAKDPLAVGGYIIFAHGILILYFSFREGLIGGFTTTVIAIIYYFYIIYTRHYQGHQLHAGIGTTITLGILYFSLAFVIGWLKQEIDKLIEVQVDEIKRLETIIEQMPVGIIISNSRGQVTHINKQVHTILGFKIPLGFTIGKDSLRGIKINGKEMVPQQAPSYNVFQTERTITNQELLFEYKKKKKVYLIIHSTPIHNSKKKVIAAATMIEDVTKQKEIEQQKDDFIAMASHELKTPLTSAKLLTQVLGKRIDKGGDKESKRFFEKMDNQLDRLTMIVSDLLDLSRIQQNKIVVKKEKLLLKDVIKQTVDQLQPVIQQKLQMTGKMQVFFLGDKEKIEQVLVNLITNAAKYSPANSKIILSVTRTDGKVVVGVQDFGMGIPKEEQKKVFERFYQVRDKKTYPGLGLGLYISSEIVKAHGGEIWVQSKVGKGATFYFSIPLVKEQPLQVEKK